MKLKIAALLLLFTTIAMAQTDPKIYDIIDAISEERIKNDVKILADFGTRHTLSDTVSNARGIGAARRWIKKEFENISKECNDCLDVSYQNNLVKKGENDRITKDVLVVNVVAVQKGINTQTVTLL